VRILAQAIRRPEDFWRWVSSPQPDGERGVLLENALRFRHIGGTSDRAVTQAAAYLARTRPLPLPSDPKEAGEPFPYWIAFDETTREGRLAIRSIARDLHIPQRQLEWAFFHFASGVSHERIPSPWWERYVDWRFAQTGWVREEAHLLWEPAREQLVDMLAEDAHRLHGEIYLWKRAHRERVESLKSEVSLFLENFETLVGKQRPLFP
jgi:hypothetical protein